jgi:hypothetical protein
MRRRITLTALAAGVIVMLGAVPHAWAVPPVKISGSFVGNDPIADCGTFLVWDEFELNFSGTEHYDQAGNLVRVVEHISGVDRLYNPDNGVSFSGSYSQSEIVDVVEGQIAVNAIIFRIAVPGAGAVFLDVGRLVFTFDDELVFIAGQHDFFEGDLAGLCAALA